MSWSLASGHFLGIDIYIFVVCEAHPYRGSCTLTTSSLGDAEQGYSKVPGFAHVCSDQWHNVDMGKFCSFDGGWGLQLWFLWCFFVGMLQKAPTILSCSGRWWKHPVKPNARPDGHGRHGCRRLRWNPTQRIPNVEINGCNRCSGRSGSLWVFESIWMSLLGWVIYIYIYVLFKCIWLCFNQDVIEHHKIWSKWCEKHQNDARIC